MGGDLKTVRVMEIVIERGHAGLFYATSPDVHGLLVSGNSFDECIKAIPGAIADLKAAAPKTEEA